MGLKHSKENEEETDTLELKDLDQEPSYHWSMTKKNAEKVLLRQEENHCFLTRYSERKKAYFLSVVKKKGRKKLILEHFKFIIEQKGSTENIYFLESSDVKFSKVSEMLQYYQDHPISQRLESIGVPVVNETENADITADSTTTCGNRDEHNSGVEVIEAIEKVISKEIKEVEKAAVEYKQETSHIRANSDNVESMCPSPDEKSIPSLRTLLGMKWEDSNQKEHTFKLISQISSKWFNIGIKLGLTVNTLEDYKQKSNDNEQCLEYVLDHWLNNCGFPPDYPMTWHGVIVLLEDIEMSTVAKELKEVLKCQGVKVED